MPPHLADQSLAIFFNLLLSSGIFEALLLHVNTLKFPLKYLRNWSLLGNRRAITKHLLPYA